jgi:hypothetical protein
MLPWMILAFAASAPAAAPPGAGATRSTDKGAEAFATCFASAQDRASRPWSFVPRESGGGTFSNAGAKGVASPYFLTIAERGQKREIRLESPGDAALLGTVEHCI